MSSITKNFSWEEMFKSTTAEKNGINNASTDITVLFNIKTLVEKVLQPVRDEFGPIKILSGYRCPELNTKVGGSSTSNHVYGTTADIESLNGTPLIDIIEWIDTNLTYKELIAEYLPDGWIHVCHDIYDNKRSLKLKTKEVNYRRLTISELREFYK